MKKLLVGLLALGSISVFANNEVNGPLDGEMHHKELNDNKSYFETLGDLYKKGKKPEMEKLVNIAWSGRCFNVTSPYKPRGATIIFKQTKDVNAGPLAKEYYAAFDILWTEGVVPVNFGDDKDFQWIIDYIKRKPSRGSFSRLNLSEELISFRTSSIKATDEYLVEEVYSDDLGPLRTSMRCYYFIPNYAR